MIALPFYYFCVIKLQFQEVITSIDNYETDCRQWFHKDDLVPDKR